MHDMNYINDCGASKVYIYLGNWRCRRFIPSGYLFRKCHTITWLVFVFNSEFGDVVVYTRLISVNIIHRYCYCISEIQILRNLLDPVGLQIF
jgi:hypothetical protein